MKIGDKPTIRLGNAIYHKPDTEVGEDHRMKIVYTDIPVRVMAVAEGYAMVRRPGCYPFVTPTKELTQEDPNE